MGRLHARLVPQAVRRRRDAHGSGELARDRRVGEPRGDGAGDESLTEAARDCGATPWQAFRYVTLPLIMPGVIAGALMAFTLSIDDFVITFFTAGAGTTTLPLQIYSMIKIAVTPEVNAVSTLLMLLTLMLIVIASELSPHLLRLD